ncbi:hypothetical protein CI238_05900, partial [Colletotrichum incanum]
LCFGLTTSLGRPWSIPPGVGCAKCAKPPKSVAFAQPSFSPYLAAARATRIAYSTRSPQATVAASQYQAISGLAQRKWFPQIQGTIFGIPFHKNSSRHSNHSG